jgi:addiction module HigA family antidote
MPKSFRHKGIEAFFGSDSLGGHWSVWVNGNCRMTFAFEGEDAVLIDYQDYHQEQTNMSQMHNPPHPGETLREDVLPALGLSVTEAARQLGVSRVQLSRVLHEHSPVSPSLALRLEQWLSGATADVGCVCSSRTTFGRPVTAPLCPRYSLPE